MANSGVQQKRAGLLKQFVTLEDHNVVMFEVGELAPIRSVVSHTPYNERKIKRYLTVTDL